MTSHERPDASGLARRHLAAVRSAIEARLASHGKSPLLSIGDGDGTVVVRLTPDAAPAAEELKREFGDAVDITVGFKPFPYVHGRFARPSFDSEPAAVKWPALHITCEIPEARIPRGGSTIGQLSILNRGKTEEKFTAAANGGWLCAPGTSDIAGGYSGAIAAGARAIDLEVDGIALLDFIVGTASCESNDRYAVESGVYEVVVPLSIWVAGSNPDPVRLQVRGCLVTVINAEPL
jgi:hypothetical protein